MDAHREPIELRALAAFEEVAERDVEEQRLYLRDLEEKEPALAQMLRELLTADADRGLSRPLDSLHSVTGAPLELGDRVGSWVVVRELGRGGMGTVFEAHRVHGDFQQRVAIKVLHTPFGHRSSTLQRFEQERDVLGRLDHPGIARILDAGRTDDGATYLVLELIDGDPIDRACDGNRLPLRRRVELVVQVCAALAAAHRQLVVHRDLKPANILVTEDGRVKLLDFGVAMLLAEDAPRLTRTLDGIGPLTPEYASPEQILGERLSTLTDVYSLGVVLYELLVGRPPIDRPTGSALQLERSVVSTEPPAPSRRVGDGGDPPAHRVRALSTADQHRRLLRGDLDRIVLQAIQRDPLRRYQSIDALQDDLENWLAGRPVRARGNSALYRARKFARRNWLVLSFAAALALSLVGGLLAARQQAEESDRQRRLAEQHAQQTDLVNSFLVDLFAAPADRWWRDLENTGRDVRVLDVLDEAATKIDVELAGAPLQQAELHQTLVDTFLALGDSRRGEEHGRRALEIRREVLGEDVPEVAESLYYLANVVKGQGRYPEALALYGDAIRTEQRLEAPTNNYRHALIEGAYLAAFERRPVLAEEWLQVAEDHLGPQSAAMPYLLARRALVALERGDVESAQRWYDALGAFDASGHEAQVPTRSHHVAHVDRVLRWWLGDLGPGMTRTVAQVAEAAEPQVDLVLAQALYDLGQPERARAALGHTTALESDAALRALLALQLEGDAARCRELALEAEQHVRGRSGNAPSWRLTEAMVARAACEAHEGEHRAARETLLRARSASAGTSTPAPLRDRIAAVESSIRGRPAL